VAYGGRQDFNVDHGGGMRIDSGGLDIEFQVSGQGPPVLLVHGFPDSGRLWRHQVEALNEAGFTTIVPDLRGSGASGKPLEVAEYSLLHLAGDVLAVLDHLEVGRTHVIGHDFGSALAWLLAALTPERVDHMVNLSVGHPVSFRTAGYEQLQKSWYLFFFQFDGVAERWLSDDSWANFRQWLQHPDADAVIEDLETNHSLTPALSWYRANISARSWVEDPVALPLIQAPTMGVWSSCDFALTEEQMTGSAEFVAGPWRYERVDGPGHWMQLESPDVVNELLLDFLPR
jgi:pimeloyl-ACP methyl ester carboxylesterase